MIFIFVIDFFFNVCFNNELYGTISNLTNVTLKIKGNKNQNIFSKIFNHASYPYKIIINGINQNTIQSSYYFDSTDNYVELL